MAESCSTNEAARHLRLALIGLDNFSGTVPTGGIRGPARAIASQAIDIASRRSIGSSSIFWKDGSQLSISRQIPDGLSLNGTKENAALKVSDTLGQQRRIAESRRPFDFAAA